MGRALEIVSFHVVNPSTTLTAVTPNANDSLTVRNYPAGSNAWLEDAWAQNTTAGSIQVKSPRMHDNLVGIQLGIAAATPQPLLPSMVHQRLYPQDTLTVLQSGEASGTDSGALLVAYDDLPGVNALLATWEQIKPLIKNIMAVPVTLTSNGTAGLYSPSQAINSTVDTFKANEYYALLGYLVSVISCSIGWSSPDFGNLRVGGPGSLQRIETRDWFVQLDKRMEGPAIPVFNAANKFSTFVDCVQNATSTATVVTSIFAELGANVPGLAA